jgi:predicted Zn-dependent protease
VQNLIGNGAEIVARGLDKDAEYEADRIGMVLTARAGYDVAAGACGRRVQPGLHRPTGCCPV